MNVIKKRKLKTMNSNLQYSYRSDKCALNGPVTEPQLSVRKISTRQRTLQGERRR